jgi:hypothetical protein
VEPYGILFLITDDSLCSLYKVRKLIGQQAEAAGGRWALPLRPAGQQPGNGDGQTATWLVSGRSKRTARRKKKKTLKKRD